MAAIDKITGNEVFEREGVKFRVIPVSPVAAMDVANSVPEPKVPTVKVPSTTDPTQFIDVENSSDPAYLRLVEQRDNQRAQALIDVYAVMGIELLSPVDPNGNWLLRLKMLSKQKILDLSKYDLNDPMDVEFLFRRYILATADIQNKINEISVVNPQAVKAAEDSFRG